MAKNDNLKDFLTDVADAIREKKGTTDPINPQDFSNEIASIKGSGVDFSVLEYDELSSSYLLAKINNDIQYTKQVEISYPNTITSFYSLPLVYFPSKISLPQKCDSFCRNCRSLQYVPILDFSNVDSCRQMFSECYSLQFLNAENYSNCTDWYECFRFCAFTETPLTDFSNAKSISSIYQDCVSLKIALDIKSENTQDFSFMFSGCTSLQEIQSLDFSNATSIANIFRLCSKLRFFKVKNVGKSSLTTFDFSGATNWGVATTDIPEARQSLIDSLITYSYDRASNGMATATIKLSANTKALLTEEEIAQITAKGFTIA